MRNAPILKPLNKDSGTFYVFPSASELLTRTISGSSFDVKFDKFALLDIPKIGNIPNTNSISLGGIGTNLNNPVSSIPTQTSINADGNIQLATAFQNYCFSFETELLNQANLLEFHTPSERIFWKFLSYVGAIKFRDAVNSETNSNYSVDNYLEGDLINPYNKVVKYIGLTNGVNVNSLDGISSSEIYIHVGSELKLSNNIYFKKISNTSYQTTNSNSDNLSGFINTNQRVYLDAKSWFDNISNRSWSVDNLKFTKESYSAAFSDTSIQQQTINRTKSDNSTIEWNPLVYSPSISSINNIEGIEEDFNFNTVLVYYTITSNGVEYTNLYGVYFTGGYGLNSNQLTSKTKISPKINLGESGNSFNFKFQLRVDTSSGQNNLVNVDNGSSAVNLFNQILTPLRNNDLVLANSLKSLASVQNQIADLELKFNSLVGIRDQIINQINSTNNNSDLSVLLSEIYQDLDWLKRQYNSAPINFVFERGINLQLQIDGKRIIKGSAGFKTIDVSSLNYFSGNGQVLNTSNSNAISLGDTGSRFSLNIPTSCTKLTLNLTEPNYGYFLGYVIRIKNTSLSTQGSLVINAVEGTNQNFITTVAFSDLTTPTELICSSILPLKFEIDNF